MTVLRGKILAGIFVLAFAVISSGMGVNAGELILQKEIAAAGNTTAMTAMTAMTDMEHHGGGRGGCGGGWGRGW